MSKIKSKCKKGFTLTEVLVVILIISVLAAIVYPMYTKVITKSRAVEAINLLEMVRSKQLQKFARDKAYYTTVAGLGQLTSSEEQSVEGPVLKVKDYTISLNTDKSCMTASYVKNGQSIFSFSSSYERSGLGCTGDICSSFGNIIGTSQDVCNCGNKTCSNGETLDENTCECKCFRGCNQGGKCFDPYGGGESRPCASGCGTETSTSSCGGAVWTGSCGAPYLKYPISEACSGGGTRTRSCTSDCGGGSCGVWSACTGGKTPCPASCPAGQKRDTAVANQEDGACCVAKTACPASCPTGQKRDTSISYSEDGSCCTAQSACPATCEAGKKRNPSVNYTEQGECCIAKTACPATCADGEERDTSISYTEDGSCCKSKTCDESPKSLCESSMGTWDGGKACACDCGSTKTWSVANGCECTNAADKTLCTNGGGSWNHASCACSCGTGKTWDAASGCVCSDTAAATKCTSSKGKWDSKKCSCSCTEKNFTLVNGECKPKFKAEKVNIGVLVNCHYCPDGFSWRTVCGENNKEDCYYGGDFDVQQGCDNVNGKRDNPQYVISYEFYIGGSLQKRKGGSNGGGDPEDAYLWWTGGERIGGKMYRYSGGSMPTCSGDPQDFCNQRCDAKSSTCNDKCLVNMNTNGCTNPRYKYCWHKCSPTRYSASNSSGTGVVVRCK